VSGQHSDPSDKDLHYVTVELCDERFRRIMDKLEVLDRRLSAIEENQKQRTRDWVQLFISVLSGTLVALITWALSHLR
jgi:tetrahydromethanopterin S-methyltransferase subunit G